MGLTLSLDTAVAVDLIRGREPATRRGYRDAVGAGLDLVLSAVVMHELILGAALSDDPAIERLRMARALGALPVIDLTAEDVEATGVVAGFLRRTGRPIGDLDTLIGGQALARGWTIVTRNVKHFEGLGLDLIDPWRA